MVAIVGFGSSLIFIMESYPSSHELPPIFLRASLHFLVTETSSEFSQFYGRSRDGRDDVDHIYLLSDMGSLLRRIYQRAKVCYFIGGRSESSFKRLYVHRSLPPWIITLHFGHRNSAPRFFRKQKGFSVTSHAHQTLYRSR